MTEWVQYRMVKDGEIILVPIYEYKNLEDEGWRRVPPNRELPRVKTPGNLEPLPFARES